MPEQPSFSESKFAEPDPNWGLDTLYFFHSSDEEVRDRLRDPGKYYGDLSLDQERRKFTPSDERAGNTQTEQGQHRQVNPGFPRLCSRYRHEYTESKCDGKSILIDMSVLAAAFVAMDSNISPLIWGGLGMGYSLWRIFSLK